MRKALIILLIATLCLMLATPALSASGASLPANSTWDNDLIDSDSVAQAGNGVYVAVLDTGLAPNWKDYFPEDRILADLGKGFKEDLQWNETTGTMVESGRVHETSFIGDTGSTHGTHVTGTIIGYNYCSPSDAAQGYPLPPLYIRGVAPGAKVIPIKVLSDYRIGAPHTDPVNYTNQHIVFGSDRAVAAGIDYATSLYKAGYRPMVITMSLGGPTPAPIVEDAINRSIDAGVIVVAAAGNSGTGGMDWPGAYPQVISVGAAGWKYEWYKPGLVSPPSGYRLWWLQDDTYGYNDIPEPTPASDVYITSWSSRQLAGQDLDVVAPGSWVRGPYIGYPGYDHLPWWSEGNAVGRLAGGNFFYLGGTSMATPHVAGVIALMLEKNPGLTQAFVEKTLEDTALPVEPGSMTVWDLLPIQGWHTYSWGTDATGSGLVQAKAALDAVPVP